MAAITKESARKLCTSREFDLVSSSFNKSITPITLTRLKQKIALIRKYRKKYTDLARRQKLEERGKRAPQRKAPAQGNKRTVQKVQLFDQALTRYMAMQDMALRDAEKNNKEEKNKQKKSKQSKKRNSKGTSAKKLNNTNKKKPSVSNKKELAEKFHKVEKVQGRIQNRKTKASRVKAAHEKTRQRVIGAHIQARGARKQARRDRVNSK